MGAMCSVCAVKEQETRDELLCNSNADAESLEQPLRRPQVNQEQEPARLLQTQQQAKKQQHQPQQPLQPLSNTLQPQQPASHEPPLPRVRAAPAQPQQALTAQEAELKTAAAPLGRGSSEDTCANSLASCSPVSTSDIGSNLLDQAPEVTHEVEVPVIRQQEPLPEEQAVEPLSEEQAMVKAWQLLPSVGTWRSERPLRWLGEAQRVAALAAAASKVAEACPQRLTKVAEARPYVVFDEAATQPPEIVKKPLPLDAMSPKAACWARMPSVGTWASHAYYPQLGMVIAELQEASTLAVKSEN